MQNILLILLVLLVIGIYIKNMSNEPTQNDIQTLEYVKDKSKKVSDTEIFPYPQISHGFRKLGRELITKPLNNMKDLLPSSDPDIDVIRDTSNEMIKKRIHIPDYYRKDRLSENTIGSEEYRPFVHNEEESENSWTDINVSNHPKYYTSDVKNELTNVGMFFDKNNRYNDKTSSNTNVLVSDRCYEDTLGNQFCEDNTRLQNVPPSLITDPSNCKILNSIGVYKE